MSRNEVLDSIKNRLISIGHEPYREPNYMISIKKSGHPQHYLRKETYTDRSINKRLFYGSPGLYPTQEAEIIDEFKACMFVSSNL